MADLARAISRLADETRATREAFAGGANRQVVAQRLAEVERRFQSLLTKEVAPVLEAAIADGRIRASERPEFERLYARDPEGTVRVVTALKQDSRVASANGWVNEEQERATRQAIADLTGVPVEQVI